MADDVSRLVLAVDSSDVRTATRDLNGMGRAGGQAETATRRMTRALDAAKLAFAGLGVANAVRSIYQATVSMERINSALTFATGSAENASREFEYLSQTSKRLALDLEVAAKGYSSLAASAKGTALEGQGVRDIFESVSTATRVMSLSADDNLGVVRALGQMMSKGKVQAEELRGQLGERLPGAFQMAAKAMNMTTAELDKFMSLGLLTAEDLLPKLAKEMQKSFGGALPAALDTVGAKMDLLKREWFLLKVEMGKGAFAELAIDVLSGLGDVVAYTREEIQNFALGFKVIVSEFLIFSEEINFVFEVWLNLRKAVLDPLNLFDYVAALKKARAEADENKQFYEEELQSFISNLDGKKGAAESLATTLAETNVVAKAYAETSSSVVEELTREIELLERQNEHLGKTKTQIEMLTIARLSNRIANMENNAATREEIALLERLLELHKEGLVKRVQIEHASKKVTAATKDITSAFKTMARESKSAWTEVGDSIRDSLTDALMSAFESGKSFAESLRDSIVSMFNSMVLRPVVQGIVASGLGYFGLPGGASAGGMSAAGGAGGAGGSGIGGWLSTGSSVASAGQSAYGYFSGGTAAATGAKAAIGTNSLGATGAGYFSGGTAAATGAKAAIGANSLGATGVGYYDAFTGGMSQAYTNVATSQAGQAMGLGTAGGEVTSLGSSVGTGLAGAGGGLAGILAGTAIAGDKEALGMSGSTTSTVGATAGAVIGGLIVPGPIGAAIGGFIGGTIGGAFNAAFGMGERKYQDTVMSGVATEKGLSGSFKTPWTQEGGWFRKDRKVTIFRDLEDKQLAGFKALIDGTASVFDSLLVKANDAPRSLAQWEFAFSRRMDSEERQIQFTIDMANSMGEHLIPELKEFQREGENMADVAVRLGDVFTMTSRLAELLGQDMATAFGQIGIASAGARSELVDMLGGLLSAGNAIQSYYQEFFTASERLERDTLELTRAFAHLGTAMPATKDVFRELVEAQDLSTDAGRGMFTALIGLAPAFASVSNAMDAAKTTMDAAKTALDKTLGQDMAASFGQIGIASASVRSELADMFGGLKSAGNAIQSYYQEFFTASERHEHDMLELTRAFTQLGTSLPATKDAFRSLVDAQDLSTDAGRSMFVSLIGLAPAFASVSDAMDAAKTALDKILGQDMATAFGQIGIASASVRSELADMFGGLLSAGNAIQSYYQEFFTASERHEHDTLELTRAFTQLGTTLPATKDAFRALVEAQDLSTDAGRSMFTALIGLAPAFASVSNAMDGFSVSLLKFKNNLAANDDTIPAPLRYSQARARLEDTGRLASLGNVDALGELQTVSTQFLDTSAMSAGTRLQMARDAAHVNTILDAAIATAGRHTPRFAAGGRHAGGWRIVGEQGPELEYTAPSMVVGNHSAAALIDIRPLIMEIKNLRAEVKAANIAVVKNTGLTAKTLRRWDGDGIPEEREVA